MQMPIAWSTSGSGGRWATAWPAPPTRITARVSLEGRRGVPSALATYDHRVLTCRGDTPALGSVRQVEWWEGAMAEPVRARRLTDQEGRRLLQIVRRGKHGSVRERRAGVINASAP